MNIKFGTDGWRAIIAKEYTTDNVARVAKATAQWVKGENEPIVIIGHDCRFGGEMFAEVTARVLCGEGVKVKLAKGVVTTPMISLGCIKLNAIAGIVITASHNPPTYNGFKLKSHFGGPAVPADIAKVEELIPESATIPEKSTEDFKEDGLLEIVDLESMYIDHVNEYFDLDAIRNSGWVIAYDAMWGAGKEVVKKLIPDVITLHGGNNPGFEGQAPEPLHKNLLELSTLIRESTDINFGFANDGDADRIGVYDENGQFVDSHHIILLLIYYLVKYKDFKGKVVVSFSVSNRVKTLCDHFGIECEITRIGFKYICEIMVNEDVILGAEESGGIAVIGHIPERDGIWSALLLLEFMSKTGKTVTGLIEEVYQITGPFAFERDDLHINDQLKQQIIENCNTGKYTSFGEYTVTEIELLDGFKFHFDQNSWVMIRPSGTEPVLRIYSESNDTDSVRAILNATHETLIGT